MSGTENATATFTDAQTSPGIFQYTITLTDTGTTPIGTFWFAWNPVPDEDFLSQQPTNIVTPAGWHDVVTTHAFTSGTGYGIEFIGGTPINPGSSSSAFSFTSTETPAQMAALAPFDSAFQTTSSFVYQGVAFASPGANIIATPASTGVIGGLSADQQLELIYIAYFNRAGDAGGAGFWGGQNTQAQAAGQSAALALTNIANSFTPQPETLALYPFLGTANLDLTSPVGQAALNAFVGSVYNNLFGRVADMPGQAFWVGQITSGAVGLGAAALAIANGATGPDAITLQNKIAVAHDFTMRTGTAGLGVTSAPASLLAAAKSVLAGVDGTSLSDASVTAGISATTAFLAGSGTGHALADAANTPIAISLSNSVIDPGPGNHTIQFLAGASGDTLVPRAGGVDQVAGFDPGSDVLDLGSLFSAANINLNGDVAALSNYVTITDQGSDALVAFDPTGHGGGGTVVVLQGLGNTVTGLDTLVARGAVRVT